jgi:hypothetical protein
MQCGVISFLQYGQCLVARFVSCECIVNHLWQWGQKPLGCLKPSGTKRFSPRIIVHPPVSIMGLSSVILSTFKVLITVVFH